jgi:hypothetical protein
MTGRSGHRGRSRVRGSRTPRRPRTWACLAIASSPGPFQRAAERAARPGDQRIRRHGRARRGRPSRREPSPEARAGASRISSGRRRRLRSGIDLCHGRNDGPRHEGDPQVVDVYPRYGDRPPWHDVQLRLEGPAVGDVAHTFRERWGDPTPFDHRNPVRMALRHVTGQPRRATPLPPARRDPSPAGPHSVQVIRTYPAKRLPYPFAPNGERSIGRAHRKALRRARRLVYVEDPYLWSEEWADAMRRAPELLLIAVVPRFAEHGGRFSTPRTSVERA